MKNNAVTKWFGPEFNNLHPLLQYLHQNGGALKGSVFIGFGKGLAGFIGKRIAKKLGVPTTIERSPFTVNISHRNNKLYWARRFNNDHEMLSIFEPVDHWPDGYWIEKTGKLKLFLGVEVKDGGWYWKGRKTKFGWLTIPKWLMPRSNAWKCIEGDSYKFHVEFIMPIIGRLFCYKGLLTMEDSKNMT